MRSAVLRACPRSSLRPQLGDLLQVGVTAFEHTAARCGRRTMSSSTQRASHTVGWAAAPLGSPTAEWETAAFARADSLEIEGWEWRDQGPERDHPDYPHPRVQARVVWDEAYLGVMFRVEDHYVQCKGCAVPCGRAASPAAHLTTRVHVHSTLL